MNAEAPQPQTSDTVPGIDPSKELAAQASPDATELIDSVPGFVSDTTLADREGVVRTEPLNNGQGVTTPVGRPIANGETISTTNNMRTPVLGRPAGMSVEQAHAMIRDQNARNAAGSQ